jgi:hypothetical protein
VSAAPVNLIAFVEKSATPCEVIKYELLARVKVVEPPETPDDTATETGPVVLVVLLSASVTLTTGWPVKLTPFTAPLAEVVRRSFVDVPG